jgi:PAS domain-containing protein
MVPVTATVLVVYLIFLALAVRAIAQVFARMHRAQQAVQRERESVTLLLRDFEQQSSDWLWESDPLGRLKRVPQRLGELLGQAPERLRGQHLWAWFERSPATANAPVGRPEENLTATASTGQVLSPLARLQQRLAETRPFRGLELPLEGVGGRTWWRLSALPQFDAQGGLIGWRGVAQDVTAERRQTEQLQWQARTDALTGTGQPPRLPGPSASGGGGTAGSRCPDRHAARACGGVWPILPLPSRRCACCCWTWTASRR